MERLYIITLLHIRVGEPVDSSFDVSASCAPFTERERESSRHHIRRYRHEVNENEFNPFSGVFFIHVASKSPWWKMASGTSRRKKKFPFGCTMDKMKDNQIWFDFVLHEIIWFISQSLHIHRRAWRQKKRSPKLKLGKLFKYSCLECKIHITFHSWIDKFDYFYARAMINS